MMNQKWVIPLKDVPTELTVAQYISAKTDLIMASRRVGKPSQSRHLTLDLNLEFESLKGDVCELLRRYPAYSYPYGVAPSTPFYKMTYLTYNSRSLNPQIANPTPTAKEHFPKEKILGDNFGKNSHNDTLSIVERTEISKQLALGELLDGFQRTLVRSRIAIQSGLMAEQKHLTELSWHTDENIFINTRISIPVVSSDNFSIEYVFDEESKETLGSFDLLEGHAYVFDTGRPHRFVSKQPISQERVSLICGFSPWFDFDHEARAWISNEFYGQVHPVDMVRRGYVLAQIQV